MVSISFGCFSGLRIYTFQACTKSRFGSTCARSTVFIEISSLRYELEFKRRFFSLVYGILKYAQDITTCRKILFERYFSKEGVSQYTAPESAVNPVSSTQVCGRCDNCNRHTETESLVVVEDITVQAFTLCSLLKALRKTEEKVTMLKLIQHWKGLGQKKAPMEEFIRSGEVEVPVSKRFSTEELERIINYLILESYLKEDFHFTAYATIA